MSLKSHTSITGVKPLVKPTVSIHYDPLKYRSSFICEWAFCREKNNKHQNEKQIIMCNRIGVFVLENKQTKSMWRDLIPVCILLAEGLFNEF